MIRNYNICILFFSVIFICLNSFSNKPALLILQHESSTNINEFVYTYKDNSANLNINEICRSSVQINFVKHNKNQINFGFTHSIIWCRWQLINKASNPIYLEISNPIIDSIEFFVFINDSLIQHNNSGMLRPFKNRDIAINRICFKIPFDSSKSVIQTFYLKLRSESEVECSLSLSNEENILYRSRVLALLFGLYLGIILIMAFYNFVLFFFIRDPAYHYYLLYVLFLAILNCWLKGYGFQYIWSNWPIVNHLGTVFVSLPAIATILFGISFLNIYKNAKKLCYGLYLLISIFIVVSIVSFFTDIIVCSIIIQASVLISGVYLFFIGTYLYYKGLRAARYYLLADGFLLIFAIIYLMTYNNFIINNFFTDNSLIIGSMLETILFSFALADKVYQFKHEKETAQLHEITTRRTIQENLESIVEMRTHEIEMKNKVLEREIAIRRKAESEVDKVKEELSLIMDGVNAMICYVNPDLEFIYVNKQFANEFGFPKEFFLKRKINTIIPSEYLKDLYKELTNALNGQFASFEAFAKDIKGNSRFFYINIMPQKDENDKVSNLVTLIYEITLIKQSQEEILHNREVIYHQEKKILEQKNLKIQSELEIKIKELSTTLLRLIKFSELSNQLILNLEDLSGKYSGEFSNNIQHLTSSFKMQLGLNNWKEFETRFIQVHNDFHKNINVDFPNLTYNEIRLCAFLRLNMSTKDIASLTLQTEESIKKARYRLRKKLNLIVNDNLNTFLSKY